MSQDWTIKRGEQTHGPMSPQKLRALAQAGKLKRNDLVRRGGDGRWRPAGEVKGLFPSVEGAATNAEAVPALETPEPQSSEAPADSVEQAPQGGNRKRMLLPAVGGVAMMLMCCGVCGSLFTDARQAARDRTVGSSGIDSSATEIGTAETLSPKDFADVDYYFEFDESEYAAIPSGATKGVEKERVPDTSDFDDNIRGGWSVADGYTSADGKFVWHGTWRVWDSDREKRLLRERLFLNDAPHGPSTDWDANGEEIKKYVYVNGELHGRQWDKYDDGTEIESFWLHGRRHGHRRETWPDGTLFSEKWFVNGVQRSPYKEFFPSGKPAKKQFYDEDGELHGVQLVWGSDSHPEPHHIPHRHGMLHGEKVMRGREGDVVLRAVYEDGEVVSSMHPAGQSPGGEMLWDLLQIADTAKWLSNPALAAKPRATISRESLEALYGQPELQDEIGVAGIAVQGFRGSDGILFFQVTPAGQTLSLDLLTSEAIRQLATQPWGDELSRSNTFRTALGLVGQTDRYAVEVARKAASE